MAAQVSIQEIKEQTTEAKKEEYRKYLEKSGVIDQLTRVLVGLYEQPEKPANAVEYYNLPVTAQIYQEVLGSSVGH